MKNENNVRKREMWEKNMRRMKTMGEKEKCGRRI